MGSSSLEVNNTINILMPSSFYDSTKELIKKYNDSSKFNIRVTKGPLETESVSDLAISSLLLDHSPYDIILMDLTWLPKYAEADWLFPLDNLIDKRKWNNLEKGAKKGNIYKDKIYRWPFVADMGLLYWRTDLINKPPETNDELVLMAEDAVKNKRVKYGYLWQGKQYEGLSCVYYEVLKGFGGEWTSLDGKVLLNSEESVKAAEWLRKLIAKGLTPKSISNFTENETLQAFKNGDSLFMRNWPYAWAELQKESSKVKGKVGISKIVSEKGIESTSTLGSWGFSILNKTKHKQEAFKIIMYLTSFEAQKYLYEKYGYTPTSTDIYLNETMKKKNPTLVKLRESLEQANPRPESPAYTQLSDVLQREISAIITMQKTVKLALETAHIKSKRILEAAGYKE
tara:strand:+ start:412 stop:1608 length:1197 start_codon:yes stop_codon:yes gene_type:complete